MSYWVYLENEDGCRCIIDRHEEGGTYAIGGTADAVLNVTYNYSWFYKRCLGEGDLRWLDGRQAAECIEQLDKAIGELGTDQHHSGCDPDAPIDYWAPTPGNAGYALNILLGWARQYPNARFRVS